jgi:hypothetical protein
MGYEVVGWCEGQASCEICDKSSASSKTDIFVDSLQYELLNEKP